MHEKPESSAAIGIDQIEKLGALFVQLPGAISFEAEKFANTQRGFALRKVLRRDTVVREIFLGEIDAAERSVFMDIANNIGELKCQAELFGKIECTRIAETEKMGTGETNRAGDAITIFAKAIEGRIGTDGEIHFRAGDQIVKIARGHVIATHGVDQRGQDFPCSYRRFTRKS